MRVNPGPDVASARVPAVSTRRSALPTATVPSASPWKTISGIGRGTAAPGRGSRIAANADATSDADRYGSQEWTPAAAKTSG